MSLQINIQTARRYVKVLNLNSYVAIQKPKKQYCMNTMGKNSWKFDARPVGSRNVFRRAMLHGASEEESFTRMTGSQ